MSMLEDKGPKKKMSKEEHHRQMSQMKLALGELQRKVNAAGVPVMIVFEGWDAASMVGSINRTLLPLDPRGFSYYNVGEADTVERQMPFMWRFWMRSPWKGHLAIFDRSWYAQAVADCLGDGPCKALPQDTIEEIRRFERLLSDDGTIIIKVFLQSKQGDDQLPRRKVRELEACGLVQDDLNIARHFRENQAFLEELLQSTDQPYAPWVVVQSDDDEYAEVAVMRTIINAIRAGLERPRAPPEVRLDRPEQRSPRATVNLDVKVPDSEYRDKLEKYQARLRTHQCELYRQRKRLVVVFEGRDASGKGGNIARVTQTLNPRTYQVVPTGAPSDMELAHHYLWRFHRRLPLPGHIAIFDRSWYGRVLVERVKGIAPPPHWRRAYAEINDFENMLMENNTVLVKLWLEVDKDVQLQRFIERVEDPRKTWKITADDWEAREQWDHYTEAIDEMLARTSTKDAPWTVVESNDKNHSRLKTLKTIIDRLEDEI